MYAIGQFWKRSRWVHCPTAWFRRLSKRRKIFFYKIVYTAVRFANEDIKEHFVGQLVELTCLLK